MTAFLTWRATGLATGVSAVVAGWRRHRSPAGAGVQLLVAGAESWWLGQRLRRRPRWSDPRAAAVDAGTAVAVLVGSRLNLPVEDRWTWINWAPWSFAANVVAGQAMGVEGMARGVAGAAAVTAVNASLNPQVASMTATSGAMGAFFVVGRFFARQIRTGAARLEAAQMAAVTAGAKVAAEREGLAQLRLLHDGAVQTLEAVGSGRFTDLEVIHSLARAEADRLRAELVPTGGSGHHLGPELRRVAAEQRAAGLTIELDVVFTDEPPPAVTAATPDAVVDAMGAGALGYLTKDAEAIDLVAALRVVAAGGTYVSPTLASYLLQAGHTDRDRFDLTSRELEVLCLVAEGETDREIAAQLYISVATVRSHLDRIRDKTGARRRVQMAAVHKAIRRRHR